jgi:hypothetical protein
MSKKLEVDIIVLDDVKAGVDMRISQIETWQAQLEQMQLPDDSKNDALKKLSARAYHLRKLRDVIGEVGLDGEIDPTLIERAKAENALAAECDSKITSLTSQPTRYTLVCRFSPMSSKSPATTCRPDFS